MFIYIARCYQVILLIAVQYIYMWLLYLQGFQVLDFVAYGRVIFRY